MAGVQDLQQSNKQRAAEKAALDRNYVMGQRYKQIGDIAMMNSATTKEQKEAYARQQQENAEDRRITNQQKADLALQQIGLTQAQIDALRNERADKKQLAYADLYQKSYNDEKRQMLREIDLLDGETKQRALIPEQMQKYNAKVKEIQNRFAEFEKTLAPIRELSGLPAVSSMAPTAAPKEQNAPKQGWSLVK
jgi:hypothetical protein